MRIRRRAFVVLLVASALSVLAEKAVLAADSPTVRITMLEGTQAIPLFPLEERIAAKHNLKVILDKTAGPQALYTKMQTGNFDVGFGAWLTMAIFRAQGYKLTQVYPLTDMSATGLVVLKESPVQGYGDLKGKKVGIFGGPTAQTTYTLRLICQKFYGFDPLKDSKLQFGAAPLLLGMVEKKELDVVLMLEPMISRMLETGKYRALQTLGKFWFEKTGEQPLLLTLTANEDWLNKNEDVAKRFVRAFKESVEFVQKNREVWPEIARKLGVETEAGQKSFYDHAAPSFVTRWDKAYVQEQIRFAAGLRQAFGGKIEGVPEKIPEEVWNFKYVQ